MSVLKKSAVLIIAFFLVGIIGIAATLQHWWVESWLSRVFLDGQVSETATVLRNINGELLISTSDADGGELYIYFPSRKLIGMPSQGQFIIFPFVAYNKELPIPVVLSSDKVKVETDMNIVEQNEWVAFTSSRGQRISVFRAYP